MTTNGGKGGFTRTRPGVHDKDTYILASGPISYEALKLIVDALEQYGSWDEGCFYYNGKSASELQEPIAKARAAIARAEGEGE
jgi:hypothetical protein